MMQLNIFAQVAPLLKEMPFEIDLPALKTFLNRYKVKEIVYPGTVQRTINLGMKEVYQILEAGVTAGVFRRKLEVYCPHCRRFTGEKFDSIFDIPEEMSCVHCDHEIAQPVKSAIVVYEVI